MKRLFVDDWRQPPEGWDVARSYAEATDMLAEAEYDVVSLDYDLDEDVTGVDLAAWMVETGNVPERVVIHSSDHLGAEHMLAVLSPVAEAEYAPVRSQSEPPGSRSGSSSAASNDGSVLAV